MSPLSAWLLLHACTSSMAPAPASIDSAALAGDPEDSNWMSYGQDDAQPTWSLDDFETQLEGLAAHGTFNPQDIVSSYRDARIHGDGICPLGEANFIYNLLICTSLEGYSYAGIAWLTEFDWDSTTLAPTSYFHGGDFQITMPDGTEMNGGGELWATSTTTSKGRVQEVDFKGSWIDGSDEGWLAAGASGVLLATITDSPEDHSATLDGGLTLGDFTVEFQDLVFDANPTCQGGLRGTLALRDPQAHWTEWRLGDDCDTCGDVYFRGEDDQGEVCLSLSDWALASYLNWLPH